MKVLTKEYVNKLNEKMLNGWLFDLGYYYMHGAEKTAVKKIQINDNECYMAHLWYTSYYNHKTHLTEISIQLHIVKYIGNTSYGIGIFHTVADRLPRKNFSEIQKETANWTDEKILALAKAHDSKLTDSTILSVTGAHIHNV